MPRDRYERILLERIHASQRGENQIADGSTIDDLDPNEIRVTLEESIRRGRMDDPGTRDVPAMLTGLGCTHQG